MTTVLCLYPSVPNHYSRWCLQINSPRTFQHPKRKTPSSSLSSSCSSLPHYHPPPPPPLSPPPTPFFRDKTIRQRAFKSSHSWSHSAQNLLCNIWVLSKYFNIISALLICMLSDRGPNCPTQFKLHSKAPQEKIQPKQERSGSEIRVSPGQIWCGIFLIGRWLSSYSVLPWKRKEKERGSEGGRREAVFLKVNISQKNAFLSDLLDWVLMATGFHPLSLSQSL